MFLLVKNKTLLRVTRPFGLWGSNRLCIDRALVFELEVNLAGERWCCKLGSLSAYVKEGFWRRLSIMIYLRKTQTRNHLCKKRGIIMQRNRTTAAIGQCILL